MVWRSTGSWLLKENVHHTVSSIYASKGLKSGKKNGGNVMMLVVPECLISRDKNPPIRSSLPSPDKHRTVLQVLAGF